MLLVRNVESSRVLSSKRLEQHFILLKIIIIVIASLERVYSRPIRTSIVHTRTFLQSEGDDAGCEQGQCLDRVCEQGQWLDRV